MPTAPISQPWRLPVGSTQPPRLDEVHRASRPLPELLEAMATGPLKRPWLLTGNPLGRADLPEVLRAVETECWLAGDGHPLASPAVSSALLRMGVSGVRLGVLAPRSDAHDWLREQPGALRRTLRGHRAALKAGLSLDWEVVLTRPTVALLPQLVELAAELSVRALWVRRLRAAGPAAARFIALSPRLGLLAPVEEAAGRARDLGLPLVLEGLPACTVPHAADRLWANGAVVDPCETCPGPPRCGGWPVDYSERFGWSERPRQRRGASEVATLVVDRDTPSRLVRQQLARIGGDQPATLRLVDILVHPDGVALCRDALRMGLPAVEVSGWADVGELAPGDRLKLRGLSRVALRLASAETEAHDSQRGAGNHARTLALAAQLGGTTVVE